MELRSGLGAGHLANVGISCLDGACFVHGAESRCNRFGLLSCSEAKV